MLCWGWDWFIGRVGGQSPRSSTWPTRYNFSEHFFVVNLSSTFHPFFPCKFYTKVYPLSNFVYIPFIQQSFCRCKLNLNKNIAFTHTTFVKFTFITRKISKWRLRQKSLPLYFLRSETEEKLLGCHKEMLPVDEVPYKIISRKLSRIILFLM